MQYATRNPAMYGGYTVLNDSVGLSPWWEANTLNMLHIYALGICKLVQYNRRLFCTILKKRIHIQLLCKVPLVLDNSRVGCIWQQTFQKSWSVFGNKLLFRSEELLNLWKINIICIVLKYSVVISQRTQSVCIRKTNRLMKYGGKHASHFAHWDGTVYEENVQNMKTLIVSVNLLCSKRNQTLDRRHLGE